MRLATRWVSRLLGLALLALLGGFLAHVAGSPLPLGAARALALAATALGLLRLALELVTGLRTRRAGTLALLGLLALAATLNFAGLDYGIAPRYNQDEGVYRKYVSGILNGQPFPDNFIYPHFVYYLDAFAIWLASLFADGVIRLSGVLYGLEGWNLGLRVVLRALTALLATLAVWPVFAAARRLAGLGPALVAGALMALAPHWVVAAHNSTNDVPATLCVALCLALVVRLQERPSVGGWLLAGLAAGLAAASKYPAGLVCVAIFGVWLQRWRVRGRPDAGLAWAAGAALAVFQLFMIGFWVHLDVALHGGRYSNIYSALGIYGGEGWLGVVEQSNLLYYLGLVRANLGWVALLAGLAGLALLESALRRRLAWLLFFPVAWLGMISLVTVVVGRNVYPLLPWAAVFAGLGLWSLQGRLAARSRLLAAALLVAALLPPALRSGAQSVRFTRPDTRELAQRWLLEELPWGAAVLKETYTPELPAGAFLVQPLGRHAIEQPFDFIARPDHDVLLLSSLSYGRYFRDIDYPGVAEGRAEYQRLFDSFPELARFEPAWHTEGPLLRLLEIRPQPIRWRSRRDWAIGEVFMSSRKMYSPGLISWLHPQHWALVKVWLEPGGYVLALDGQIVQPAEVELRDLGGRELGRADFDADGRARFRLGERGKLLLYLRLGAGSRVAPPRLWRDAATEPDAAR